MEKAASIYEAHHVLNGEHPVEWANVLRGLATVQDAMGNLEDCADSYTEALELLGGACGKDHLDYGEVSLNLSCIELRLNQLDDALEACKEAQRVFELIGEGCEPQLASALMNTAVVYKKRNKNNRAFSLLVQACEVYKQHTGEDTVEYALCTYNLAMVLGSMQRLREAAPLFQRCASIYERSTPEGRDHPQAKAARHYLSLCGDVAEAENDPRHTAEPPPSYSAPPPLSVDDETQVEGAADVAADVAAAAAAVALPAEVPGAAGPPSYEEASSSPAI